MIVDEVFCYMKKFLLVIFFVCGLSFTFSQTKVSGHVYDENGDPVAFANVLFKDTTEGTITNENGRFYLESENTWSTLIISFFRLRYLRNCFR